MSDTLLVIASAIEIDRPVDVVRSQFYDLDHAIRDDLYDGVSLKWLPAQNPGERRIRQEARMLGSTQVDEILAELSPEGGLVKRFVDGPNAGAVYRYAFEPMGDQRTRVIVAVTTPASGLKRALGPLYKLAVKSALRSQLTAHKRDLEQGFVPGRARGNLSEALVVVREALEARAAGGVARAAVVAPLIEAACLTAVSDGEVDDAERDAIRAVVHTLGVTALDDDAVEAVVASSIERTRIDGTERRCNELGLRLKKLGLEAAGLCAAALVAHISHGLDPGELATLQRLGAAAGLSDEEVASVLDRVDEALSKPAAADRKSTSPPRHE